MPDPAKYWFYCEWVGMLKIVGVAGTLSGECRTGGGGLLAELAPC
jgi:hypothetical protein